MLFVSRYGTSTTADRLNLRTKFESVVKNHQYDIVMFFSSVIIVILESEVHLPQCYLQRRYLVVLLAFLDFPNIHAVRVVPWRRILSSKAVWAIVIAHAGSLSSLPYFVMGTVLLTTGGFVDCLKKSQRLLGEIAFLLLTITKMSQFVGAYFTNNFYCRAMFSSRRRKMFEKSGSGHASV
ncbi:hypothetical protein LOAG_03318 [Loa loa]|uniref:Uncharacterized protein n=1 Tax=Loa loa TaxID=7209 RepID=A0A1S0U4P2_LOALO|nr:hypothetical protein LOAG_03318 [Loa loa]EFO25168.1 hypothetical protein LOAG_03318 [Loa loa]